MKKILLSFAVALVAMSASAQSTRLKNVNLNLSKFNVEQNFKTIETPAPLKAISISASNSKAKIVKKADADNSDIFGLFIQTFAGEDVPEFTVCLTDTIYKADATVKVPIDTLGNTTDVKCNICLKRNFGGYRISEPYYGIYEEDDNGASIIFPEQISLKADGVSSTSGAEYHYDIYMYNINLTDDGTQIENVDLLSFEGDGDGVFYSSANGWGLSIQTEPPVKDLVGEASFGILLSTKPTVRAHGILQEKDSALTIIQMSLLRILKPRCLFMVG